MGERAYIVAVDTGSPYDTSARYVARSPAAARYASFKAWREAGYGCRMTMHDAFVWFSKNIVVRVYADRSNRPMTNPSETAAGVREQIARIIASWDWPEAPEYEQAAWVEEHWEMNLAKADQILTTITAEPEPMDDRPLSEIVADLRKIGETVDWGPDPIGDLIRDRHPEPEPLLSECLEVLEPFVEIANSDTMQRLALGPDIDHWELRDGQHALTLGNIRAVRDLATRIRERLERGRVK